MKTICLYFQIHQPQRLKTYRFFNIGSDHYYYDDFTNEDIIHQISQNTYVPANRLLLEMIKANEGKFKVALSISGVALDQLEIAAPEAIDGFKLLAETGCVEFLSETYSHSLASLIDPLEFTNQVEKHRKRIKDLFNVDTKVFRNTELIYNDEIGNLVEQMGFKGALTEGARHILGWKSPNFVYQSATSKHLKLLLRNERFSDDLSCRFSDYGWDQYPLTADKYISWIAQTDAKEPVINLFLNYEVLGNFNKKSSGIFDFFRALPRFAKEKNITFSTPSEVIDNIHPIEKITITHPISWVGREKDTSMWLGNPLQEEAFAKLYSISERVKLIKSRMIQQDWLYLQCSDHFYYMGTKENLPFSPYPSPFEAFSNYMNVFSDFKERVEAEYPTSIENEELNALLQTINNQNKKIRQLEEELQQARQGKLTVKE